MNKPKKCWYKLYGFVVPYKGTKRHGWIYKELTTSEAEKIKSGIELAKKKYGRNSYLGVEKIIKVPKYKMEEIQKEYMKKYPGVY